MTGVKVKPLTGEEKFIAEKRKWIRLKFFLGASFIMCIFMFIPCLLFWIETKCNFNIIGLCFLLIVPICLICSFLLSCITLPKTFFFDFDCQLICDKCRGRIYQCKDGSYACYCGCKWSRQEVSSVVNEYRKSLKGNKKGK